MPIYVYKCKECGKKFDVLQKFSDKPVEKCIYCNGKVEKEVSTGTYVLFKGNGWTPKG